MELGQIRMVKAVAETGSVARAAQRLHCVPSNVTARIKALESELGTPLFIRAGRGLVISPAGKIFLPYAEKILALTDEAKRAVDANTSPSGSLRIGAIDSCASGRLPPLLAEYHQRYPNVTLELTTATGAQLLDDTLHRRLDGVMVALPSNHLQLRKTVLYQERLFIISAKGLAPITRPDDLKGKALLMWPKGCPYRAALEKWLADCGLVLPIVSYASWGTIIGCVRAGAGIALVPEGVLEQFGAGLTLSTYSFDALQPIDNFFVEYDDEAHHPAREAFVSLLRERLNFQVEDHRSL